jgi:hypothetical protein
MHTSKLSYDTAGHLKKKDISGQLDTFERRKFASSKIKAESLYVGFKQAA